MVQNDGNEKSVIYTDAQQQPELVELVAKNGNALSTMTVDLSGDNLPSLEDAEVGPFDLSGNYWTPEKEGESKLAYFLEIKTRPVQDQENKDVVRDLPCAFFLEKVDGEMQTICNGSKRLVACIENNNITKGTPLKITYLGKKKNSTNQFKSDSWKVNPLLIKIGNEATNG